MADTMEGLEQTVTAQDGDYDPKDAENATTTAVPAAPGIFKPIDTIHSSRWATFADPASLSTYEWVMAKNQCTIMERIDELENTVLSRIFKDTRNVRASLRSTEATTTTAANHETAVPDTMITESWDFIRSTIEAYIDPDGSTKGKLMTRRGKQSQTQGDKFYTMLMENWGEEDQALKTKLLQGTPLDHREFFVKVSRMYREEKGKAGTGDAPTAASSSTLFV